MKGMDIFCSSQAATAIRLSLEHDSSSSSPAVLLGGRFIDRHNPVIRRIPKLPPPCTTSQPPISPKPRKVLEKNKKTSSDENENQPEAKISDGAAIVRKSWSCTRPGDFLSPPGSTRYLLREKSVHNSEDVKTEENSSSLSDSPDQVVVLRVSLHCRGCEKKLRKHLSRMEGLKSFDIDFAAKKVTVTGNVTPLGVLSSISKVKNAQLWSPAISSSFTPSLNSELNNVYKGNGV